MTGTNKAPRFVQRTAVNWYKPLAIPLSGYKSKVFNSLWESLGDSLLCCPLDMLATG